MSESDIGYMLVPILIALAFAGAVFAFAYPYISEDRQKEKRVDDFVGNRTRKIGASVEDAQANRKKNVAETLKEMEQRQKAKEKITMRLRLQRAGLEMSPRDFYIVSAIAGVLAAGIAYNFFAVSLMATGVIAFVCAFGLPRWFVGKMTKRRQSKFVSQLATAIDVIVRGVKSGLPLNECLQVIARESPEPLAREFRDVVEQQRLGVPLGDCLERMCERMPLPEVRFLAIVIAIQQQAGGNLSEALSNLAGVIRDRQMLALKVKALSAEAKASALVLGCLPPGVMSMVYMSSPDYIMPLFTTKPGNFMLLAGAVWMSIGIFIMRKMINFKF
jgi:tight adherence protein B